VRWPLVLLVVGACGDDLLPDGAPLTEAPNLTIVAHQDDDLLFMQPDLLDVADAHAGLVNVYVTAGNGNAGVDRAQRRYRGLRSAYAEAAGVENTWTCGWIDLAGHTAEHCRLDAADLSLVFLGYPDGGKQGELDRSLLKLWTGELASTENVADRTTRYDQAGLIDAVAAVIADVHPTTIRTLDLDATHGRDHSDHLIVGALTALAVTDAGYTGALRAFRGYATDEDPDTLIDPLYDRSRNVLAHYEACVRDCGRHTCGSACDVVPPEHEAWLRRRYAIGFRREAHGALRTDAGCVRADASVAATCSAADTVGLGADGLLRVGGRCLTALPSGDVIADASCIGSPGAHWLLDDEGHLWNGAPPAPERVVPERHLTCLVADGGRLHVDACGEGLAPRWELTGTAVAVARPSFLPATGRAIRGFGTRVYAVVDGELWSAAWTGLHFALPDDEGPLPVEPESLAVGMLDGKPRACGRDAGGVLCLAIEPSATAERWTPAFAGTGELAVVAGELCGLGDAGVMCATRGAPAILSPWPAADSTLWAGDLDGDARPDWCAATPSGLACGRDADRWLTTDGVPWSYSIAGTVDRAPTSTPLGVVHDIDDDGRDDLCTARDGRVWCVRSQGTGFGPELAIGAYPQAAPTALWFASDQACVDDGVTVACFAVP
jgi:LmbE family N-acetylglucosaminyl deacetylase